MRVATPFLLICILVGVPDVEAQLGKFLSACDLFSPVRFRRPPLMALVLLPSLVRPQRQKQSSQYVPRQATPRARRRTVFA